MAAAFVKGLQGGPAAGVPGDGGYLKVSATCKVRWQGWGRGVGRGREGGRISERCGKWVRRRQRLCCCGGGRRGVVRPRGEHPASAAADRRPLDRPPLLLPSVQHLVGNDLEDWQGYTRYNFNARITAADLRDSYWPPFEACVAAGAASIMCSYNQARERGRSQGWGSQAARERARMLGLGQPGGRCVQTELPAPPSTSGQRLPGLPVQAAADRHAAWPAWFQGLCLYRLQGWVGKVFRFLRGRRAAGPRRSRLPRSQPSHLPTLPPPPARLLSSAGRLR